MKQKNNDAALLYLPALATACCVNVLHNTLTWVQPGFDVHVKGVVVSTQFFDPSYYLEVSIPKSLTATTLEN